MQPSVRSVALLTLQPQRHLSRLEIAGLRPKLLAFQPALSRPERGRWQLLPPAPPGLIVDLAGLGVIATAMLIADLQHEPALSDRRLVFLIPETQLAARRLLAMSALPAIVIPADAPSSLVHQWLTAPLPAVYQTVWVDIPLPPVMAATQHLVPLLAALAHADTVPEAATWCHLSGRRAYELLTACARQMRLPSRARRRARRWASDLNRALLSLPPDIPEPKKEPCMDSHPFEVIAANLCGCVIERIHAAGNTLTLEVEEPRQGRLMLHCQGATLLNPPEEYADLAERSSWERRVDWADIVAEDIIALYLADERCLMLCLSAGRFERAAVVG